MKYVITSHAKQRMVERSISVAAVENALQNPTKVLYDDVGRLLIKKLYRKGDKTRLLLVAGEKMGDKFKIITVIETSKVKKYL